MGNRCSSRENNRCGMQAVPACGPILSEHAMSESYSKNETRQAIARTTSVDSIFSELSSARGEAALFARATAERMQNTREVDVASTDLLRPEIHQETHTEWCGRGRRGGWYNITRHVEQKRYESQSVVISEDVASSCKVKVGSQDRVYLNVDAMRGDKTIDLVKSKNALSNGKLVLILDGKQLTSATFQDGVATLRFANGQAVTVKGIREGSDVLVAADASGAKAGKFVDVELLAEKMPHRPYEEEYNPPVTPQMMPNVLGTEERGLVDKDVDPFARPSPSVPLENEVRELKTTLEEKDQAISSLQEEVKKMRKELGELKSKANSEPPKVEKRAETSGSSSEASAEQTKANNLRLIGFTGQDENYPGFLVRTTPGAAGVFSTDPSVYEFIHPKTGEEFVMRKGNGDCYRVFRRVGGEEHTEAVQIRDGSGNGRLVMAKGEFDSSGHWKPYDDTFMKAAGFVAEKLGNHQSYRKQVEGGALFFLPAAGKFYFTEFKDGTTFREYDSNRTGDKFHELWCKDNWTNHSAWDDKLGKFRRNSWFSGESDE